MAFVTLKIRSSSPSSIFVFALPWCLCVPNSLKVHYIFPQIMRGNHLAHVDIISNIRDLEIKVKVTIFKACLCLAMGALWFKFGESS